MRTRDVPPLSRDDVRRFWRSCSFNYQGCWEWQATLARGYGRFRPANRGPSLLAHRVAWTLDSGPIAPGVSVLHRCDNPKCVRPTHLRLGVGADNMRDMIEKGRDRGPMAQHRQKTHCKRGHAFDQENTIFSRKGKLGRKWRRCRECHNAETRAFKRRKRAASHAE